MVWKPFNFHWNWIFFQFKKLNCQLNQKFNSRNWTGKIWVEPKTTFRPWFEFTRHIDYEILCCTNYCQKVMNCLYNYFKLHAWIAWFLNAYLQVKNQLTFFSSTFQNLKLHPKIAHILSNNFVDPQHDNMSNWMTLLLGTTPDSGHLLSFLYLWYNKTNIYTSIFPTFVVYQQFEN